jgi:hypothetical protein
VKFQRIVDQKCDEKPSLVDEFGEQNNQFRDLKRCLLVPKKKSPVEKDRTFVRQQVEDRALKSKSQSFLLVH